MRFKFWMLAVLAIPLWSVEVSAQPYWENHVATQCVEWQGNWSWGTWSSIVNYSTTTTLGVDCPAIGHNYGVAVYGQVDVESGFDETAPLLEPSYDDELTMDKYGELKVACEQVAAELAGDRLLIIRPGYVLGPHDPTHRFTYWVERVAQGDAPMAGPDAEQPLQGVDARDLGAFTVSQIEAKAVDAFHVTAPEPAPTFAEVLETIATAIDRPLPEVRWVGAKEQLPLTAPADWWPKMRASLAKARAAGFTYRPLADTARDTYEWVTAERAAGRYQPRPGVGPTPEQEQELLS